MRYTPARPADAPVTAPAGASASIAAGGAAESIETELRQAEAHYENAIKGLEAIATTEQSELDPRTAATLQKNLAVIDQAISESRAAVRLGTRQRTGAAEPDRRVQDQDRAAPGHRGADQRNAQRQRGRSGADRLRSQTEGQLTCDAPLLFVMAGLVFVAMPAAGPG